MESEKQHEAFYNKQSEYLLFKAKFTKCILKKGIFLLNVMKTNLHLETNFCTP